MKVLISNWSLKWTLVELQVLLLIQFLMLGVNSSFIPEASAQLGGLVCLFVLTHQLLQKQI